MNKSAIFKYNKKIPRYTSYPSIPHFKKDVSNLDYMNWLGKLSSQDKLSLYFHIPFCQKLCWYCGCNTQVVNKYELIEKYKNFLIQEIKLVAGKINHRANVHFIHFGGGSPNMLSARDFLEINSAINEYFDLSGLVENAIELDPRVISEGKVAAYRLAGINRVSLGVQDFNPNVQANINRIQPFRTIYSAVNLLKQYGINNINMDLMYGLPGQTIESVVENINLAIAFKPKRIAFFGYAHVPDVRANMRLIDESILPNPSKRIDMFQSGAEILVKEGYQSIGLDHFVLPTDNMAQAYQQKKLRRNFQGYTIDNSDALLGFGVSSISRLPQGFVQNTTDKISYYNSLRNYELPVCKGYVLSQNDLLRNEIIQNIMCYLEVDLGEICEKYNRDENDFDFVISQMDELIAEGLVNFGNNKIKISDDAKQISRYVSSLFDEYFQDARGQHSQVA